MSFFGIYIYIYVHVLHKQTWWQGAESGTALRSQTQERERNEVPIFAPGVGSELSSEFPGATNALRTRRYPVWWGILRKPSYLTLMRWAHFWTFRGRLTNVKTEMILRGLGHH